VWREIARYVERDAPQVDTLVELGPGYCDFINQFPATHKIAFDLNPDTSKFAAPDVQLRIRDAVDLDEIAPRSVDLVFASNFLEHLGEDEVDLLLSNVRDVLSPSGRLILLQPNYRRCADHYFDDPTHKTVFDDRTLADRLARHGFRVIRVESGLLPFSMKSRLPKWPILIRLYLHSPIRPLAAQMYVVAEPV
jgi:SAM-dependent methyltransferase